MSVLDEIALLRIEIDALRRSPSPTREDYAQAIREYFADIDTFEEWMVDPLIAEIDEHNAVREAAQSLCALIFSRRLRKEQEK